MFNRTRATWFAISASAMLVAAPAIEAQTTFSGTSSATFNSTTTTLGGLSFGSPGTPWSFNLSLGQTLSGISFGTLYLDDTVPYNYSGNTLDIDLIFTAPGGGNQLFAGALSGTITSNQTGQVNVSFNGPFVAALSGGYTVSISLNSITGQNFGPGAANNTDQASITGSMTYVSGPGTVVTETVPEPITMILMGTGLAGVAAARRRRRKALSED